MKHNSSHEHFSLTACLSQGHFLFTHHMSIFLWQHACLIKSFFSRKICSLLTNSFFSYSCLLTVCALNGHEMEVAMWLQEHFLWCCRKCTVYINMVPENTVYINLHAYLLWSNQLKCTRLSVLGVLFSTSNTSTMLSHKCTSLYQWIMWMENISKKPC